MLDGQQDAATLRWMIAHAKFAIDHLGYTASRPHVSAKSKRLASLVE